MILLIDNYDSFVHNLARYVRELGFETLVQRNDALTLEQIAHHKPSHIILSPGPCTPLEAGITLATIQHFTAHVPILGVCLGHQAIGHAFGGAVVRAKDPRHGKTAAVTHSGTGIFSNLPNPMEVGLYHSLAVSGCNLPADLRVTATTPAGEIMGLEHTHYPTFGVQFHPESILTPHGQQLLFNFLSIPKIFQNARFWAT